MSKGVKLTTAVELDALTVGSIIYDIDGERWQRVETYYGPMWEWTGPRGSVRVSSISLAASLGPFALGKLGAAA